MTKLLLDESLPRRLINDFPTSFDVSTVQNQGWAGVTNGKLLRLAADHGYTALLTADKNLEYQQNLKTLPCAVIVLQSVRTRHADLRPLIPEIVGLFDYEVQGVIHVGA